MAEDTKRIVIAPRAAVRASVPDDWQEQVASMPGITMVGSSSRQMHVDATEEALESARSKLGHLLHFEEAAPRGFAD